MFSIKKHLYIRIFDPENCQNIRDLKYVFMYCMNSYVVKSNVYTYYEKEGDFYHNELDKSNSSGVMVVSE